MLSRIEHTEPDAVTIGARVEVRFAAATTQSRRYSSWRGEGTVSPAKAILAIRGRCRSPVS